MTRSTRAELLTHLADAIAATSGTRPTRVAVDGPPATGKTTLADELAAVLRARTRHVIRASIDDFLHPRAQRYARGEYSAEGCYYDTHNNDALIDYLLDPLGPSGHRRIRPAAYDHTTDTVLSPPPTTGPGTAILIVDGVFLMRPELTARWDLRIFVSTAPDKTISRAALREGHRSSRTEIEHRWRNRYLPAQQLYFADANPTAQADTVVHNDNPLQPAWETKPGNKTPPRR